MKRAKTKLIATSGLLAAGLVMTPFLAANADQTPAGAGAVESNSLAANEQVQAATSASAWGLASGEKLTVKAVIEDADGGRHVRDQRTRDGLRVIGGDLVAHKEAKGTVTEVTYNLGRKSIAPASRTPKISTAAAQAKGLATARATKDETTAGSELVVLVTDQGPKLAYDVLTTGIRANLPPTTAPGKAAPRQARERVLRTIPLPLLTPPARAPEPLTSEARASDCCCRRLSILTLGRHGRPTQPRATYCN